MKKTLIICIILLIFLSIQLFAEDSERWGIPNFSAINVEIDFPLEKKNEVGDIVDIKVKVIPNKDVLSGDYQRNRKYEVHVKAKGLSFKHQNGIEYLTKPDSTILINYKTEPINMDFRIKVTKKISNLVVCYTIYEVLEPDSEEGKFYAARLEKYGDYWKYRIEMHRGGETSSYYPLNDKKKEKPKYEPVSPEIHIKPYNKPDTDDEKNDIWRID